MASVPVVHDIATFVSVRRGAQMTKEERSAVNAMQRNGPMWWDGMTPGNVVAHPRSHPLRPRQTHLHARVARVDVAGQPVGGSFDRHSYLEGPQLHFRADKNRDQCFDWEMEEEAKFGARGADEGERDCLARKCIEVRSRTIRRCLDALCRPHGVTLQQLEDRKIVHKVSCRW